MISTSLNHCKEMGAKLGRRSLKMPAEKLGPVIVIIELLIFLLSFKQACLMFNCCCFHNKIARGNPQSEVTFLPDAVQNLSD